MPHNFGTRHTIQVVPNHFKDNNYYIGCPTSFWGHAHTIFKRFNLVKNYGKYTHLHAKKTLVSLRNLALKF